MNAEYGAWSGNAITDSTVDAMLMIRGSRSPGEEVRRALRRRMTAVWISILMLTPLPAQQVRAQDRPERPNIVVIMADDMGYSDIGSYGSEIRTPNLDRLAAGGLRFRQFYNFAICSPTRAALLTGRYPHQVGMAELAPGRGTVRERGPRQGYFPEGTVTIADALRSAGYRTYMSGKWHLGEQPEHWPRQHGFDRYFGLLSGASSFYELLKQETNVRQMALEDELWTPPQDGFYMTDAFTDYAEERIREHHAEFSEQPFFLYVAYTAPHFPLHALSEDIERYEGRYDIGWDSLRAERYARMRTSGTIDARHALPPRPSIVPAWEEVANRSDWTRRMEVYAAMVDRMDQGIGRILQALEATGVHENTLVIFLSDNGGTWEDVEKRGLNDLRIPIGARGSYLSYLEPWANVSNTPFRLYKHWMHEGGIITPLIAYWPEGIREPGRITGELGHVMDLMPTALELAGAVSPALEGRSLVPVLEDRPLTDREPLFWSFGGNAAVRQGAWKLVFDAKRAKQWELYDLSGDPTELDDVALHHPGRVASLRALWNDWADRVGVERP